MKAESPRVMRMLERAKHGDTMAIQNVMDFGWEKFGKGMAIKNFSHDPAEDMDDLKQIFQMAMLRAIPKLDARGNPIYHMAQRGWWAIQAHTHKKQGFAGQQSLNAVAYDDGNDDVMSRLEDPEASTEEIVVNQVYAEQVVAAVHSAELSSIARRTADAILSNEIGVPGEIGFNKKLAAYLDVSEQRASQGVQKLRAEMEGVLA
jgi:hypothetical protein